METRRAPRKKIQGKVSISIARQEGCGFNIAKDSVEGDLLDINEFGAGLLSQHFFPKGVIICLQFRLPQEEGKAAPAVVEARGEVRSAISGGHGLTRLGISFLELSKEAQEALIAFMKEK